VLAETPPTAESLLRLAVADAYRASSSARSGFTRCRPKIVALEGVLRSYRQVRGAPGNFRMYSHLA
jgi:hypothetical protein